MRRTSVSPIYLYLFLIAIICFAYIYARMQCVEIDYKVTKINREINKHNLSNKELKAKKAKYLSPNKLKSYAKKNKLQEPKRDQIIILK